MSHSFPHRLGRTLSVFAGLVHLVWIILIWVAVAQPWLNFVYGMHAIGVDMTVQSMGIGRAVGLLVLTLVVGYVVGWVLGAIWDKMK